MLILTLQAALSAAALFQLYRTRMLPGYYLAILAALLALDAGAGEKSGKGGKRPWERCCAR